ncbi:transglycosylase SLT domain-containing protein [Holophaga foetida]|uniref:transglycosylase SLT domain-containing protein n=1 Tax=Holophaga foetida TaxID=35839 RepID=UPI0002473300|nr:transglycosylase SLT domain-containing protein [Holophaga foetida]
MNWRLLPLSLLTLALAGAGKPASRSGTAYLYTYYDRNGSLVINNLPPSSVKGQGLILKHVGVGHVRLAMSRVEMSRVLRSPELLALVDEIATAEGVDPFLARAIIQAESAFNYRARSRVGALGLMQLMPQTAQRFGVLDPFDPRQNISGGTKYLRWLLNRFKGDTTKVVAAYNAGEGAVERHGGIPPYKETRAYVPRVLDLYHRKLVQPDPRAAGSMALLKKGHGGFKVEESPAKAQKNPETLLATATPAAPTPPPRLNTRLYRWTDDGGRFHISDQPPPRGTRGVKVTGTSE